MNPARVRRLVSGVAAVSMTALLGAIAACGGGAHPGAASDDPLNQPDSGTTTPVTGSGVTFNVDLDKGISFGENGFVNCGTQAADGTFTLKNTTKDIVNYTISVTAGTAYYKVTPTEGGIPGGATATIKITPTPIPQESDVSTDLYAGTLQVSFPQISVPPTNIRLHQTARGAVITTTAGATINMGSPQVGKSSSVPFSLTNAGNMEATANFKVGTEVFTVGGAPASSLKLAPGASESTELKLSPQIAGDLNDTLAITYNSSAVFCQPPPSKVALTGKGTTSVGVTPGVLDFGLVNCGATAPSQTLTITSTIAMDFSLGLTKGTQFTLTDKDGVALQLGTQIHLDAASSFAVKVVPKAIPPSTPITDNLFGDQLTVTTSVAGDVPHAIPLKMTAKGAILAFSPAAGIITTSTVPSATTATNFSITNSGNAQIPYQLKVTNPDGNPFTGAAGTFLLGGDTQVTGNLATGATQLTLNTKAPSTFSTSIDGALSLSVTASDSAALCADLPPRYPVKANTVAGTSITLTPPALEFGEVNCGSTAATQDVTLTSLVGTTFTPDLVLGVNSPFTLKHGTDPITLGQAIPITAGGSYVITVVPKPMPSRPLQGTTVNAFGDTMTIKSPVDPTKNYDIRQTAKGVIFSFNPTILKAVGAQAFAIINSGNVTGNYTVSASGANSLNLSTGSAPKGTTSGVVTVGGPGEISITSTSNLCADLPGNIVIDVP